MIFGRLTKWFKEGNDCEKCPCAWEEWGPEDCDAGCYAGGDLFEEVCRKPLLLRQYIHRRVMFFKDHEYDGFVEWMEEQNQLLEAAEKAFYQGRADTILCWKGFGGKELKEYNQDSVRREICRSIISAIEDVKRKNAPHSLREEWAILLKKTAVRAVFKIRSILTI